MRKRGKRKMIIASQEGAKNREINYGTTRLQD